jgi:N2-(2-carboxyethyl)arginine synthase
MHKDSFTAYLESALVQHHSHPALRDATRTLTYAELDALSLTWAHRLRALGVGYGDRIVSVTGNTVWSAVGLLAILRSGAVEVALHPSDSVDHLRSILQETQPSLVLVADCVQKEKLTSQGVKCPVLVAGADVLAEQPEASPEPLKTALAPEALALIHYTSGSTGTPKGVMLSHGALAATLPQGEHLERIRNLRLLLGIPLAHAYGKTMLMEYLLAGAYVAIQKALLLPSQICHLLQHHRASALEAPPTVFEMALQDKAFAAASLPELEYLAMNSAKPREELLQELRRRFPRAEIVIRYGISEVAGPLCRLTWNAGAAVPLSSCGKPVAPACIQLLDETGGAVPAGAEGEVVVRSPGMMNGYFRDGCQQLQAYRTGDIGRFDAAGFLYLLGRRSTMIKSAGHRIFPAEIEAVVRTVPGVADCAVAGLPDQLLGEKICAWVVPQNGTDRALLAAQILESCRQRLGAVCTPQEVCFRTELPKTLSAKTRIGELIQSRQPSPESKSVAFQLLDALHQCGVKYVCGIVGREAEGILFDEHPGIQFLLVHHEQTAGILCEVYARITGKPQVCFSTLGPGVTNLLTGVASAYKDRSPLFAISAQTETPLVHRQAHQCLDNVALMQPLTKRCFVPGNLSELLGAIREAHALMLQKPKGPCFINLPIDVLLNGGSDQAQPADSSVRTQQVAATIDRDKLAQLHHLLERAAHPVVLCGGGAQSREISKELQAFIESRHIPLVTSLAAKGVVSDRHPLCIGPLTKYSELFIKPGLLAEVFTEVDLILLVGYDFAEDFQPKLWQHGQKKLVCRIDEFANDAPEFVALDLDVFGGTIAESLACLNSMPVGRKKELAVDIGEVRRLKARAGQDTGNGSINPVAIVQAMRRQMQDSDILISDVGLHKHYAGLFYDVYEPLTYFGSNGLATLGFGLPAVMGAQLARPEARAVAICGDGGFHAASHELSTCARYHINVTAVVLVDGGYGLIRHYQFKGAQRHVDLSTRFTPAVPDFVKLAEANHCVGLLARSVQEFETQFQRALGMEAPVVIAVPITYPL